MMANVDHVCGDSQQARQAAVSNANNDKPVAGEESIVGQLVQRMLRVEHDALRSQQVLAWNKSDADSISLLSRVDRKVVAEPVFAALDETFRQASTLIDIIITLNDAFPSQPVLPQTIRAFVLEVCNRFTGLRVVPQLAFRRPQYTSPATAPASNEAPTGSQGSTPAMQSKEEHLDSPPKETTMLTFPQQEHHMERHSWFGSPSRQPKEQDDNSFQTASHARPVPSSFAFTAQCPAPSASSSALSSTTVLPPTPAPAPQLPLFIGRPNLAVDDGSGRKANLGTIVSARSRPSPPCTTPSSSGPSRLSSPSSSTSPPHSSSSSSSALSTASSSNSNLESEEQPFVIGSDDDLVSSNNGASGSRAHIDPAGTDLARAVSRFKVTGVPPRTPSQPTRALPARSFMHSTVASGARQANKTPKMKATRQFPRDPTL